jgi:hypothetical protein
VRSSLLLGVTGLGVLERAMRLVAERPVAASAQVLVVEAVDSVAEAVGVPQDPAAERQLEPAEREGQRPTQQPRGQRLRRLLTLWQGPASL